MAYRESQSKFALSVMEAIKNKEILLIQAGVGTGKSFGYLIPIFMTWKNVETFDKILISTSSIGLEEQLDKDIDNISKLLDITIKHYVCKGINNYACIKRIENKLLCAEEHADNATVDMLNKVKRAIYRNGSCDRKDLPEIKNELWKTIRMCGGCDRCDNRYKCPFTVGRMKQMANASIVVTNHTQLSNLINRQDPAFTNASMVVIDEAHNLEEQLRLATEDVINFDDIADKLHYIKSFLEYGELEDYTYENKELTKHISKLLVQIFDFARELKLNAKNKFKLSKHGMSINIHDCDKLPIDILNIEIKNKLNPIIRELEEIIKVLDNIKNKKGIERAYENIKHVYMVLSDMNRGLRSKNLYWIKFVNNHNKKGDRIELVHSVKSVEKVMAELVGQDKCVAFTSATLVTNGNYDYFIRTLGIKKAIEEKSSTIEDPIESPFDYENNSLFYYDSKTVNPNVSDRIGYVANIASKVKELIEITNGKALVLFTNKTDMEQVYKILINLGVKQKLILQKNGDVNTCKKEFIEDTNSCLFATGAFWEGMDIPGKTLSNLIVVKLPFPVQDPIVEYRKSKIKGNDFEIDLNEMLNKLAQGTGRLIRKKKDIGIVCCLDSRIEKYLPAIKASLPFTRYTKDINELVKFSQTKILDEKENIKILKKVMD